MRVEAFATRDAPGSLLDDLHALCVRAFDGDFDPEDWDHAVGGMHFVAFENDRPVAHASVIERTLWIGDDPHRTGYVEAVAVEPDLQGQGFGTAAMRMAGDWIGPNFEVGGLATGEFHFYERLGWQRWRGLTYVFDGTVRRRSPEADGAIMVLPTDRLASFDLSTDIACGPRPGDDW